MDFTITFLESLVTGVVLVAPVFGLLGAVVMLLGLIVGQMENWRPFDALYWAFITAATVGYGDMRPGCRKAKVLSVFIALFGIMLTGLLVAITVESASIAFEEHVRPTLPPDQFPSGS